MKAHRKIYMLAISPNKKLERSYQIEEYISTKNSTHLHYFDLRVWRLTGAVQDMTLQQMQGKCASQFSSLPKAPYKIFRSRMIKREGKTSKYALVRNHLQNLSDPRELLKEQKAIFMFSKTYKTPSF